MWTKEEIERNRLAIEDRNNHYPYEFIFTWEGEGGSTPNSVGASIYTWIKSHIIDENWCESTDGIGYASGIHFKLEKDAMLFRLTWSDYINCYKKH